ncbi:MAG: type I-C CRISPR-associated protein Cas8c/Csd1 [Betaproteobacteria bacterium]
MILQALYQLYGRLSDEPDSGISPPGYSKARVSFALNLSEEGELLDLLDLRTRGTKLSPRMMDVPHQFKRSGTAAPPYFLCDKSEYVLGLDGEGKPERARRNFEAFRDYQNAVLDGVDDPAANAVRRFLLRWNPDHAAQHPLLKQFWQDLITGGNIVFKLDGARGFVHEREAVRAAWDRYSTDDSPKEVGQCLVTGDVGPIARLHDSIKGVAGAQPSGAALVSFNLDAFTSYGKEKNYNAPVGEHVAFGYVTALNYLLQSDRHRLSIGDATTVFWAERSGPEEDMLAELLDPSGGEGKAQVSPRRDPRATQLVRDVLARVTAGLPIREVISGVDPSVRFFILGLSPNVSRLSVRFWQVDTFGSLVERIGQHYADMALVLPQWETGNFPVRRILKETAPLGDSKRISPLLGGAVTRSILLGTAYPQGLYTAILSRIRADQKVNPVRAAVVKACLVRNARILGNSEKEGTIRMSLNEESTERGYLLGRLFALLEKAQEDATPGLNATIRDRYFGAASAAPLTVFPVLLRLAQHHLSKAEYGHALDRRIQEVMAGVQAFPAHLSLEEQGLFVLGYYHQRHALYQKKTAEAEEAKN